MHSLKIGGIMWVIILLCALALRFAPVPLLSSTGSASVLSVAGAPTGYDPLTAQEADIVAAAALQSVAASRQPAASAEQLATDAQEVLLVERHEADKAAYAKGMWPRQADVYVYDYATDTLLHTLVDVQSSAVITVERVQGVQLPLTVREEQRALALVQADNKLWSSLADRYQTITGEALAGLEQLQVKVSVFHADVMPDRVNAAAQACGQHRCAQVLLFTVDKTLLDMTPIVDLSLGQVVQVLDEE